MRPRDRVDRKPVSFALQIALDECESIQRVNSTGTCLFAREMFPLLKAAG